MRSFPARRLLEFIDEEAKYPRTRLLVFALIAGLANGLLLATINHGAGQVGEFVESGTVQVHYLAIYACILAIFVYTKKYTLDQAAVLVEEVLCKVRMRIADKIRHADLEFIERTGHSSIYNCLSQDTVQISQSANVVFASIEAGIMLCFALAYIAWLTFGGFMVTVGALLLGTWVFELRRKGIIRDLENASREEVRFFESLHHTLAGFKEIKLNRAKSAGLFGHQGGIADEVRRLKSHAGVSSVFVMMFSQIFFYVLLAVVLFVWPYFEQPSPGTVIKLTASILFIIGPLELLVGSLPLFLKADGAVGNLRALEARLDAGISGAAVGEPSQIRPIEFQSLRFEEVVFEYRDADGAPTFRVGPVSFEVKAGEILFIVGGNGSGKSTLLKLLTGLYRPVSGTLLVNGAPLDAEDYPDYRELFSIIFTDFHLFDRFYGLENVDTRRVGELIRTMGLADKTRYRDGAFTNLELSTGQRKRLAYIAALLDDRQVYVFDEWAADQDPEFRRHFYETMLGELRSQGKTIVAVTHDDRYFGAADRVLRMEEGQISPLPGAGAS
jgi:putative ATP-binding cassette transporter